jgi:hypothetical protein
MGIHRNGGQGYKAKEKVSAIHIIINVSQFRFMAQSASDEWSHVVSVYANCKLDVTVAVAGKPLVRQAVMLDDTGNKI